MSRSKGEPTSRAEKVTLPELLGLWRTPGRPDGASTCITLTKRPAGWFTKPRALCGRKSRIVQSFTMENSPEPFHVSGNPDAADLGSYASGLKWADSIARIAQVVAGAGLGPPLSKTHGAHAGGSVGI